MEKETDALLTHDIYTINLCVMRKELTRESADQLIEEAKQRFKNRQEDKKFQNPEY